MSKRQVGQISRRAAGSAPLQYKPRVVTRNATPAKSFSKWWRIVPLVGGTATLTYIVYYSVSVYRGLKKDIEWGRSNDVPLDVSYRYDRCADNFDSDVDTMERLMAMKRLRKEMCSKARGNVLEVSAGTGRNMAYYPLITKAVKSITMVDQSQEMVTVSRIKWAKTNAWFGNAIFRIQDAALPVQCPAPGGFDTVIQTFGICSTPEPEKLLRNLGNMTNPDGGRILLLEHGRSYYKWLDRFLDSMAPAHANRYGCWWNKDIGQIVESSGLQIVEQRRYHFGTTWWFELKPAPRPVVEKVVQQAIEASSTAPHPWWFNWWK